MIAQLTRLALGRSRSVLVVALGALVAAAALGLPATGILKSSNKDYQDPASQFEQTSTAIRHATGQSDYYGVVALLEGERDIATDRAEQAAAAYTAQLLARQHGFERLLDYPASHSAAMLSRNRRTTVVMAAFATPTDSTTAVAHVRARLTSDRFRAQLDGMRLRLGGPDVMVQELNDGTISSLQRAEMIALPIVLLLSFWIFRGLIAALLPPLVGIFAIMLAFLALRLANEITPISVFSLNIVTGMGLGLGIDYSLFVLSRYREELAGGLDTRAAIARTLQTAGRTVLYSSLTVAAALTCLLVFPIRFLYSMGIGGAAVALCDGAVALIVLPALLLVLDKRIDALSPAWLQRRGKRAATVDKDGGWWKLAHGVMRHPGAIALGSAVVLLAAAAPALELKFTVPSANLLPLSAPSRQVEDTLASDFPTNPAEITSIVLEGSRASSRTLALTAAKETQGAAVLSPPRYLGRKTWEIDLLPHGSPFAAAQQRLIERLRASVRRYGATVGGEGAFFVDQKAAIASHFGLALVILALLTAAFLFALTGSVAIPLKAFVMNLLTASIGAGLLVLIFQDGALHSLLGFTPIGGLEESSLVLMFVIAFALSTDYEVFVLGRIKEARDGGLPNREAVAVGLERTGRLVTAAALLFCVAVGALTSSELFFTKQFGLGTALAVAIDASIVRALLVPSLMALLGEWNWWAPRALRRLHGRIGLSESAPARSGPTQADLGDERDPAVSEALRF
jgi:putative drug exporter of the RND superfamily